MPRHSLANVSMSRVIGMALSKLVALLTKLPGLGGASASWSTWCGAVCVVALCTLLCFTFRGIVSSMFISFQAVGLLSAEPAIVFDFEHPLPVDVASPLKVPTSSMGVHQLLSFPTRDVTGFCPEMRDSSLLGLSLVCVRVRAYLYELQATRFRVLSRKYRCANKSARCSPVAQCCSCRPFAQGQCHRKCIC